MKIQFKKGHNKPSILTCIRNDGTKTWVKMYAGIETHDLGHYAVETALGFENAFYGMVAKGANIEDFELPREKRPIEVLPKNLHPEALISEHLVNLLMTKAQVTNVNFDISNPLKEILIENNLPFPSNLTDKKMSEIWEVFNTLGDQWKLLPEGQVLELEF